MKQNGLFSHKYKRIGWVLFIPCLILGVLYFFGVMPDDLLTTKVPSFMIKLPLGGTKNDWFDEIIVVLGALSMLLIGFSRERDEDELISAIRMRSLAFAAKCYTLLLIIFTLCIFGLLYWYYMIFNLFLMMLIFIVKFEYELYKFRKRNKEVQQ